MTRDILFSVAVAGLLIGALFLPHAAGPRPSANISLTLTPPAVIRDDQPSAWTVTMTNLGQASVSLVHPGDGSECAWRTPAISWTVKALSPQAASQPARAGRCGNINPATADEVFILRPRESVPLKGWIGAPEFPGPGTYEVTFRYENAPEGPFKMADENTAAMRLIRDTNPARATSNTVKVEVLPAKSQI